MNGMTRRKLIRGGVATAAGFAGLAAAAQIAAKHGLIPPDSGEVFGAGETLTYAVQRVMTAHSLAREFPRSMISKAPFISPYGDLDDAFARHQALGFADWKLQVDGMVDRPTTFSISDLRSLPPHSQITEVVCEEGWSYVAEWIGPQLKDVLHEVGVQPGARYIVYFSSQKDIYDSIDMADALHPQTFLTMGMNGGDLPVGFGGPLRLRVPRQLGYKSVKFVTRLTATDSMKKFGTGLGSVSPDYGYSWYAGI